MSGDRGGAREAMSTQDHGAWRAGMEAESRDLRRSVDVLFGKVDAQSGKLDAITTALHEIRGAAGPSIKNVLIIIGVCAGLFASVSGGIIYLARGGNSTELHQLELRIQRMETILSIVTTKRPPASGMTWVPEVGWR